MTGSGRGAAWGCDCCIDGPCCMPGGGCCWGVCEGDPTGRVIWTRGAGGCGVLVGMMGCVDCGIGRAGGPAAGGP